VLDLRNPKAYYWRETKGFPPYLGYPYVSIRHTFSYENTRNE